jgi:hypothetical protein
MVSEPIIIPNIYKIAEGKPDSAYAGVAIESITILASA